MQQLDQIETANEQILADKNKLLKEQEDLKQQLQTLETDKKQLETKLAEQAASITATPATATPPETESAATAAEALDPAILNQQLDEIESANEQLLTDKKQLEQERDQLKQQLQTLQAENKQAEASSTPPADTASVNPDAPDPTILTQQLDEIEAANEQLLADKNKLQSDLETAQQQLKEREQTMSVLSGQITENKQQLETTQQELLLANAARASAELNKASLENQRGSWWPWLLALAMLPLGWLLGRRSATPTAQAPEKIQAASSVSSAPVAATAVAASELPNPELANELPALESFSPVTSTLPALAANDDNLDAAIKLDIVRAYLDLRDPVAASTLLKEIMREGGQQQQQEAREILSFLA
jgi:FimV-like protein